MIKIILRLLSVVSLMAMMVFSNAEAGQQRSKKSHQPHHAHYIFPENLMYIPPVNKLIHAKVDKTTFNTVLQTVRDAYEKTVAGRNGVLVINGFWNSGTVNAYARRLEDDNSGKEIYEVNVFGGVARHPLMTTDGLALVLCHELGHHLAGKPLNETRWGGDDWSSVEGQSDYFATTKCLRKIFAPDDNRSIVKGLNVPADVQQKCATSFADPEEGAICQRSSMAGYSVVSVFADISAPPKPLDFSTPDKNIVKKTYAGHPELQCRLDTYFAGALCQVSADHDFSAQNEWDGACVSPQVGSRPLCWYSPSP